MHAPKSLSPPRSVALRRLGETALIAAVGGITLGLIGFPAGWLTGSMLAVAIAAIVGRPMAVPAPLMRVVFTLIGISLGAVVTPETLHGVATWPLSIAALALAMACMTAGASAYLRAVHGWDRPSAMLASLPGALSQVMVLAAEIGADLRAVAIVQSMRVVIVSVGLPVGLVVLGLAGAPARTVGGPFSMDILGELGILVILSSAVATIFQLIRFPGGLLFGAMICSAVLHGTGYIHAVMPWWIANAAMVSLGAITGSRFANTPLRLLWNFLGAAFGSFAIAIAIAALFVLGLTMIASFRVADVVIAFAPGAVDAMMVLALALNIDPVYVGAHHLARIMLVSLSLPFIARRTRTKTPAASKPPAKKDVPFED